mmetsp:Transcript_44142/g.104469  ORF Transcript_44142/g.104469 Transcript_44142/m.104469 type:complete len:222 (+) Transcript_44142:102-767(+)
MGTSGSACVACEVRPKAASAPFSQAGKARTQDSLTDTDASGRSSVHSSSGNPRTPWDKELRGAIERRKDCYLEAPQAELGNTFDFTITLKKEKPDDRLGIAVTHCGDHLCVKELYGKSVVERYNEEATSTGGDSIQVGDLIYEVNSAAGSDKTLVSALLETHDTTVLYVRRPVPVSPKSPKGGGFGSSPRGSARGSPRGSARGGSRASLTQAQKDPAKVEN